MKARSSLTLLWEQGGHLVVLAGLARREQSDVLLEGAGRFFVAVEPFVDETDERVNLWILRGLPGGLFGFAERFIQPAVRRQRACQSKPCPRGFAPFERRTIRRVPCVSASSGLAKCRLELGDAQRRPHLPLARPHDETLVVGPRGLFVRAQRFAIPRRFVHLSGELILSGRILRGILASGADVETEYCGTRRSEEHQTTDSGHLGRLQSGWVEKMTPTSGSTPRSPG